LISFFAVFEEMARGGYLGDLELMVLLALMRLGADVPIAKELHEVAGREVALGSIYAALERLERKQFITSRLGEPTPERGGRAKRYFRITAKGRRALETTRTALVCLWSDIPSWEGGRA
jgi:DNA-binding PadR family transcriptional regulator